MKSRRRFVGQLSAAALAAAGMRPAAGRAASGAAPAVLPLPPPAGSQLGSLYPFVERIADTSTFPLSYTHDAFGDLKTWKTRAREKVLELLHYAPAPCEPRAETVRRVERDGYVQEDVSFQTTPDIRVPAALLVPAGLRRPAPGIVALHDHGAYYLWGREKILENDAEHPTLTEFRQRAYAGTSIAAELARRGYVVLVIDMFYWGERRVTHDDDPPEWRDRPVTMAAERVEAFNERASRSEPLAARALMTAGTTWPGVMLWDDIRSVDYLVTRPEVDPRRLGCVGLSVGGLRSMYLAALDDRIRAAVICGWMASFPAQLKSHLRDSIGFSKLIPGVSRWLDYPDIASLAMPTPVLAINGRDDGLFEPAGVQHCFDTLAACYRKAGVPDRFQGSWYDAPHEFNLDMQAEAWNWLGRWLRSE